MDRGQEEYVIGRENCVQCRSLLDEQAIASRDRFCTADCWRIMQTWQNANYHYAMADRARWADGVARKEGIPERACAWCFTVFKPATPDAVACSSEHAASGHDADAGEAEWRAGVALHRSAFGAAER